jgi:CheY-like chemotaxis protein
MSGAPRRILVVEDHPTLRQAILLVLRDAGMLVQEAAQGDVALAALRRERPDAILLDMNMPGASGAEVLTALRADPATATIPVIVMTATGDEGRAAAMALGAAAYLTKPFSSDVLLRSVEQVLGASGSPGA